MLMFEESRDRNYPEIVSIVTVDEAHIGQFCEQCIDVKRVIWIDFALDPRRLVTQPALSVSKAPQARKEQPRLN
jgi:hypothetical protein